LRHISIRDFRGVRELDWSLPDRLHFCLIGRGDSTKSTVLEAIRRVFHPHWSLAFDDSDFFECAPATNPIKIDAIVGDLPDEFIDLATYGYYQIGWDAKALKRHDDPGEGIEAALCVSLIVKD